MIDERKSRAVLIYLSEGRLPFPRRDPDGVVREFPQDGAELLAYAEAVIREMESLPADWSRDWSCASSTGLAMREICGPIRRTEGERIWTDALGALLTGLGSVDRARTRIQQ